MLNVRLLLPPLVNISVPPALKLSTPTLPVPVVGRPTVTSPPVAAGAMLIVPLEIWTPDVPSGVPDVAVAITVAKGLVIWVPPVRAFAPANEFVPAARTTVAPPTLAMFNPPPPETVPDSVTVPDP